ncbi:MAG: TonB-dependent receptor [Deltaproteobacteria bacterium]|nr:TonB-dependent receptor [Deltaproteobacteria bacterium]
MGDRFVATVAFAIVFAISGTALAAPRTIRGVVTEQGSPTPIEGASVLGERGDIAVTDLDGYFTIIIDDRDRELTIAASGFIARTIKVPRDDAVFRVELRAGSSGEVIEVSGRAPEETKPLSYALTADEIRVIPGAGNDILRAIQILPGVARIPYSFGGIVLRGMSPRDTAVFLDGIEVPLAFHFGGVTSFYPGGMLSDIKLTSGGFDASYGRAQGGLVTLATREPRRDRWRMGGSIGLLDSSVQFEGPLPGKGGIIVGLRRSYFDAVIDPFVEEDVPLPSYWDYQIRTSWGDPRKGGRISPMIFGSIDRVASDQISLTSTFLRLAAPMHRQWGPTTLHVVPWLGLNRLSFDDKEEGQQFARPTYPGGIRAELTRDVRWGHLRGGAELSSGYLAPTQVNFTDPEADEIRGTSTLAWTDIALWTEVRYKLDGERFALKPGVRAEVYGLTGELVVDPRLNIHQQLSPELTMRQSIGRYHQPPTPGDVDSESGNIELDSSYVDQLSLGVDAKLPHEITTSVTGFFHYGQQIGIRLRNPRPGGDAPEPNLGGLGPTFELLLEKQLGFAVYRENIGRSRSGGAEVMIKRNVGSWFTMLSYTFAISQRTDDPRATDISRTGTPWRPFELDQRHNLQIAVSKKLTNWRFGARLQVVSGNPYSPTTYDRLSGTVHQDPWGANLPTYVSLDLRADRRWRRCWGDINLYIDIQNVTNRGNIEGREFNFELGADEDIPGLPIIPFIGVEFLPTI